MADDEPKMPQGKGFLEELEEDIARREQELREHPERRNTPEDRKRAEELKARTKEEIELTFTSQSRSFNAAWKLRRDEPKTQEERDALYRRIVAPLNNDLAQPARRRKRSPSPHKAARRRIIADNRDYALQALTDFDALMDIMALFDQGGVTPTRGMVKHLKAEKDSKSKPRHGSFVDACTNCLPCRRSLIEIVRRDITN